MLKVRKQIKLKRCFIWSLTLMIVSGQLCANDTLRDPTAPLTSASKTKASNELNLGAIVSGEKGRFAIINGKICYKNTLINGARVVEISKNTVSIQKDGLTKTLSLRPKILRTESKGNEG